MKTLITALINFVLSISSLNALSAEFSVPENIIGLFDRSSQESMKDHFDASVHIYSSSKKNLDTVTFALREGRVYFYLNDELFGNKGGYKIDDVLEAHKILRAKIEKVKPKNKPDYTIAGLFGFLGAGMGSQILLGISELIPLSFIDSVNPAVFQISVGVLGGLFFGGQEYLWAKYGYKDGAAQIIDSNLNKLKNSDLSHIQINTSRWGSDKYGRILNLLVKHLDKKMSTCELMISEI
ncbi:MAG: hypothetical protein KDD34_06160 [Bdellovibrionales bacterium]|nr:hypothetical protein [Bdellovibrionales bacterium]